MNDTGSATGNNIDPLAVNNFGSPAADSIDSAVNTTGSPDNTHNVKVHYNGSIQNTGSGNVILVTFDRR